MRPAYAVLSLVLSTLICVNSAWADGAYILDAETNAWLAGLAKPLYGHMPHSSGIHFVVVDEPDINAFVDGDKNIHLNSGLLLRAQSADEVRGVLAHEMGHVAAQHIFQAEGDRTPLISTITGAVLGIGTMAAGAPQAGAAILTGSQAAGLASLLKHSRQNEMEADNRAVEALHAAGYPVQGMLALFSKLRTEMQLSYGSPPPYLLTHPMPAERMQNLQSIGATEAGRYARTQTPAEEQQFKRIQARIYALSHSPAETLRQYPGTDDNARYARALALAVQGKTADAKTLIDALIAAHPRDYFYRATAADLATSRGDLATAKTLLEQLLREDSTQILLHYQLGDVLRNLNQPAAAVPHLEMVTRDWRVWAEPWQSLGIVYGQLGRLAESQLALAEYAVNANDRTEGEQHLKSADAELKKKPDPKLQSWHDDIKNRLDRLSQN